MACFNVMFTHHTNLATNVNPDLGPLFVLTKVVHLGILNYPALVNYDYIMSGYVKITLTCNYRNIFPGALVFPREFLGAAKNRTILTTTVTQRFVQVKM